MTTTSPAATTSRVLPPLAELLQRADDAGPAYRAADPFPHGSFDDLLDRASLEQVAAEMPPRTAPGWTTWETRHEWKYVFDQPEYFGPAARRLQEALNSSEFVRFLERLTGVAGLIPDPHLTAAGYFDIEPGGFLDVHLDFTHNPKLNLLRRVNVLVYLNTDWQPEWGGQLELWRSLTDGPVVEIVPTLGRVAIFSTPGAAHGHPKPITTPNGRSRLCFSAYYFTSPDAPDSPATSHGVLFSDHAEAGGRAARFARQLLPPVVVSAAKAGLRLLRRRAALRRAS